MQATAQTILNQLGGSRFTCITGARQYVSSDDSLTFKLPSRFAKMGINHVRITLNGDDTYDMTFYVIRGTRCQEVARVEDIYADSLTEVFRDVTGLDTRL